MKKIGVISKSEYFVPRINKMSDLESLNYSRFLDVKSLEIGIIDEIEGRLKLVSPSKYPRATVYNLGQLVEYDDESNEIIKEIGLYRQYSEQEINQIYFLYRAYAQRYVNANNTNNDSEAKEIGSVLRSLALNLIPIMQFENTSGLKEAEQTIDSRTGFVVGSPEYHDYYAPKIDKSGMHR